ncbi:MAG: hypothetical protein ACLRNQ_04445 [Flavonifractor plautii]
MGIAQSLVFTRCQAGVLPQPGDQGADRDSFTVCTPPDAPPLADHLARDKEHFYQNDEIIEEPLWLERLHELKPEQ